MIYNPSLTPLSGVLFADPLHEGATFSVLQGNVLIAGPTTPGNNGYVPPEYPEEGEVKLVRVDLSLNPESRIYLDDNYYEKHCGGSACLASPAAQWMLAKDNLAEVFWSQCPRSDFHRCESRICRSRQRCRIRRLNRYVTANAGARPLDRDAVDRPHHPRDGDSNRKCAEQPVREGRAGNRRRRLSQFWRSTGGH